MSSPALHVAVILSPFLTLPLVSWLATRRAPQSLLLALIPAGLTAYFAYAYLLLAAGGSFIVAIPWASSLNLSLSFYFDGLSTLFAMLIAFIGTVVVVYATAYFEHHEFRGRFFVTLFAFMGSMLGVVLSDNVIVLFVFWELTGFTSYLLIGFDHERPEARRAATQALIVTGGGGLALLAAGILIAQAGGTASLSALAQNRSLVGDPRSVGIAALLLLAAFTKSAQFPFHFWLPNAMQAPTPVSAYLHSATMVKAGVYLVARTTPIASSATIWTTTITIVATLTMAVGAGRALFETDLKRILAYSTISALGILMLLFGIGTPSAVTAALAYLIAHACYKGALFLVAGAIEHEAGTRDARLLCGLGRAMPWTAWAAALAAASMAGIPLAFGFVAKEQFYEGVRTAAFGGLWIPALIALAVAASACLGAAGLVAGVAPFRGRLTPTLSPHDAPRAMWTGPLVLGVIGLLLGVFPGLASGALSLAGGAVIGAPLAAPLVLWHGFTLTLLLSAVTLAGSIVLFAYRARLWPIAWPSALQTERLYAGSLRALDAVSRMVAPALQSASLRAYVLTVVVTAVVLGTTAVALGGVLPTPRRWTSIQFHEAVLALIVVTGALSAAAARSNMVAVLSLGSVGYGIAVLYALLGAPDLAMTQFAVETLTVVIFVLVFYQLQGFGDLSSRWVKVRDGVVAVTAGALVTTLVLFVGASGTTSRLADYFANAAPRLAHGRNVVNVILVDFRGFDTLGETTVLVTVAVGVRALLLIRRERHK